MRQQAKPEHRARAAEKDGRKVLWGAMSLVLIGFAGMALPVRAAPQPPVSDASLLLALHRLASGSFALGISGVVLDKQMATQEVSQ